MKTAELRKAFINFFTERGHTEVPSSSLIPDNDPTLLFSNAGMNQFKETFLGTEKRPYTRAVSSQKCLRISGKHNDLENVGVSARHHTFFEMLGNFSFGDYFKKEAIQYGWEFVTGVLQLPESHLWVTIYEKDDEAEELWKKHSSVDPKCILRMDEKDNYWSMGDTGPCGPCSEIFYYTGDNPKKQSEEEFRKDDGTYMEIWNLVFMQFNKDASGTRTPLSKQCIDTGMGLERTSAVLQNLKSNYDTDILRGIITRCEELSGFSYDGSSYKIRDIRTDETYARDVAMRVIADHSRAISFLIAEGITPGSDGRSYVLRRLIRRAIRHGRTLGFKDTFLANTCETVVDLMKDSYTELQERSSIIHRVVEAEEQKFRETLDTGMQVLQKEIEKLPKKGVLSGATAFLLHDTYGFPLDLTEDILKAYSVSVDHKGFSEKMSQQKTRSRDERKSQNIQFTGISLEGKETEFLGYECTESESKLQQLIGENDSNEYRSGESVALVFEATPFYAESGGQVGDTGVITFSDETLLEVTDTQKAQNGKYIVHYATVKEGKLNQSSTGQKASLRVDSNRRNRIRAHHSATHLVHTALRAVLGDHVKQAGSRVDEHSLRFDYSHFEAVKPKEIKQIQELINKEIRLNHEVITTEMALSEAKEKGAMALFGEKYADTVRVVEIGPDSLELCGGTHVSRSGDIGFLMIDSESGISAGTRRVECVAGYKAYETLVHQQDEREEIASLLKTGENDLSEKVERLLEQNRELEKEIVKLRGKLAKASSEDLIALSRISPTGVKVIAEPVEGADVDTLRTMIDRLRQKPGIGVVALGSAIGDSTIIVAGSTKDVPDQIHVGNILKEATSAAGGRGGGKKDFAQGGGVASSELKAVLDQMFRLIP